MGCTNEVMPNFIWDERQKKMIIERFSIWRCPNTSEEIALYKEINSKIDEFICLMCDNDEKAESQKSMAKKPSRKRCTKKPKKEV